MKEHNIKAWMVVDDHNESSILATREEARGSIYDMQKVMVSF